jgi:hypothetical protein
MLRLSTVQLVIACNLQDCIAAKHSWAYIYVRPVRGEILCTPVLLQQHSWVRQGQGAVLHRQQGGCSGLHL